ncbi:MAG: MBL fold metallo-hydrolase [Gemmataceae bacterium]|nr:MBL fold metallo-hydrolase [Gemmata sp.]MDW8198759.1 MBL fold metallo-hydrolase [Gemmataceae bacterium]
MKRLILIAVGFTLLLAASRSVAQQPGPPEPPQAKALIVRWYGQSFFQVETAKGHRFAFDPHGIEAFGRARVKADFVLVSHTHDDHALIEMIDVGEDPKTKELKVIPASDVYRGVVEVRPGKQEWKTINERRGEIRIRNVATYHDTMNGLQRGKNSVFLVEVDGLVICHLGDLGHELTDDQIRAIGKVDILMVPVGGIYTINGEQAVKVVQQLQPRLYVLPMHYGVPNFDDLAGPEEFLDGIPKDQLEKRLTTNELVIPLGLQADKFKVVLLGWRKPDAPPPLPPKEPKK